MRPEVKNCLEAIKAFQDLLISRREKTAAEDRQHLEYDIMGYEEILKSGSERNAKAFLHTKREQYVSDVRFSDNLAIVEWMKNNGVWE